MKTIATQMVTRFITRSVFHISLLLLFMGCTTQPEMYYWGSYEELLYKMYQEPGSQPPATQIAKLTVDIQQAENSGKPIAPGIYAHLGFMYAMNGNITSAEEAFAQEKILFPESSTLIDGMLRRARQTEGSTE